MIFDILIELLKSGNIANYKFPLHFSEILFFTLLLFFIGFLGVGLNNRNILTILMSIELMLLSAVLNYVLCSAYFFEPTAQIYALIILALAAAESAVGLALLILYYKVFQTILLKDMFLLRG